MKEQHDIECLLTILEGFVDKFQREESKEKDPIYAEKSGRAVNSTQMLPLPPKGLQGMQRSILSSNR
jgi:hypothetical protein